MAAKLKIRKGDKVVVITGKDKGKQGEVVSTIPSENRAVVRGVNVAKRHQKQTAAQEGGISSGELPIHVEPGSAGPQGRQADPCGLQDPGRRQEGARRQAFGRSDRWLRKRRRRPRRRSPLAGAKGAEGKEGQGREVRPVGDCRCGFGVGPRRLRAASAQAL